MVRFHLLGRYYAIAFLVAWGNVTFADTLSPTGIFPALSSTIPPVTGRMPQTMSPDGSALSVILEGMKLEAGADDSTPQSIQFATEIPVQAKRGGKITIDVRGGVTLSGDASCKMYFWSAGVAIHKNIGNSPSIFFRKAISVKKTDRSLPLVILLSCRRGVGSEDRFLAELDSIDLQWSRSKP